MYLLAGDNSLMRERVAAKLRDAAVPAEWRSMNAETVWADESSEAALVELARTPPFGSPRRFLLVREVEVFRGGGGRGGPDDEGEPEKGGGARPRRRSGKRVGGAGGEAGQPSALLQYVREPEPTTVLVLVSERWNLRKWESDELPAAMAETGAIVPCARPVGAAMYDWLTREAAALGITMERAAASELVDRLGDDPLSLYREVEKLASHAGDGGRVAVQDVLALTGDLAAPSIFHFLDVLFVERRRSRAMSLLSRLLRDMHPLRLHSMLLSQLRKIIALKGACEKNMSVTAAALEVKLPVHLVSQLRLMAQRTPYGRFAELLRLLAAAEARLKRGGDGRQVLEGLVLECCK